MGHRKYSAPRHGSLAYLPRGRAARLVPRVKYWPDGGDVKPLGFIAYKAGMTSVYYVDNTPNSPFQGTEVQKAATVLAAPPMWVVGIALYENVDGSLRDVLKIWSNNLPDDIRRRIKNLRPNEDDARRKLEKIRDRIAEVRLIVATQTRVVGAGKKPHITEIKVGGEPQKALEYALSKLGGELKISEVFREGDFIDVIGVTKGKGFQGVVKRYGVSKLQHKSRKTVRGVGAIGGRKPPYVTYLVPRSGQMGYHRRTEFNKRILVISEEGEKYTPRSGFHKFGIIRSDVVVVEGSVPGTPKRPIVLRAAAKPPQPVEKPEITLIKV